jgi:sulfatase maturation enzyme AslB (radical SAM superfamily)
MGVIGIYTTNRCNLKCKYCFAEQQNYDLDLKKAYEFIDYYSSTIHEKTNTVIVTGGESLLSSGLKELCNQLIKKFSDVTVLTNGVYLTDEWLKYFQEKNISIHISMDSITPEYHEKYRGHFKETKEAADRMMNFKSKQKSVICMTLSYENIEQLYPMMEYVKENDYFLDLNIISLDPSEKLSWSNATKEQIQFAIKGIDDWINLSQRVVKGKLMKRLLLDNSFYLDVCYNRTHSFVIHSDGDIYPCFMKKKRYFGNIYTDSFEKIIQTKRNLDTCKHSDDCFSMACMGIYD